MSKIHPAAEYLKDVNIEGNVIPLHWFQIIGEINRYGQFKANLLAVNIMAEVVYWYRPVVERNQDTGFNDAVRMKFSGDKYQFSYRHIKVKFGASKKSAKSACDLLIKLAACIREFKHETIKGVKFGNVMYLEPDVEWLKANALPPKTDIGVTTKKATSSRAKGRHPTTQNSDTNTETSTETSTESFAVTPLFKNSKPKNKKAAKKVLSIPEIEPLLEVLRFHHVKESILSANLKMLMANSVELHGIDFCVSALKGRIIQAHRKGSPLYLSTFFDPEKGEWMGDCANLATVPTVQAGGNVEPHIAELMAEFEKAQCL